MVLGIETSCDETGVAIIRASAAPGLPPGLGVQAEILAQALHSQVSLHAAYGGVVPELASRNHIQRLAPLCEQVIQEAGLSWEGLDAVAYTEGPGLAGALLVGDGIQVPPREACLLDHLL